MKKLLYMLAGLLLMVSACTQKTCPTYAQDNLEDEVKKEERV